MDLKALSLQLPNERHQGKIISARYSGQLKPTDQDPAHDDLAAS
jgi:hypothetical protein